MAKYTALITFVDTQTNHLYRAGDTFPCSGISVTIDRITELASCNNAAKKPVIAETKEPEQKKADIKQQPKAEETPVEVEKKPEKKSRGRKRTT